jgi:hypothetical protein
VSCLMIEALESFYQGWPDSRDKSQRAFCNFFDRNHNFSFIKVTARSSIAMFDVGYCTRAKQLVGGVFAATAKFSRIQRKPSMQNFSTTKWKKLSLAIATS